MPDTETLIVIASVLLMLTAVMNARNALKSNAQDCPKSKDGRGHCRCWWDCSPCCWCTAPMCDGTDCDSTHEDRG